MKIKIQECSLHLIPLRTRMPFKYGIATMVEVPHAFVRLRVEVNGHSSPGTSADLLPPKWFTKDPAKPLANEIDEMLYVIDHAMTLARSREGETVFDLWRQIYDEQLLWGTRNNLPPLLTNFGTSLIERSLIEAVCSAARTPFAQALRNGSLGCRLDALHSSLNGIAFSEFLPPEPLREIVVRHTVGLADPLTDHDILPSERLADGLPQSLASCAEVYGLRHFKLKLCGDAAADLERLRQIARVLDEVASPKYAFSLDGNEQFKSVAQFHAFWESFERESSLRPFRQKLLFVEQPLHRDAALQPGVAGEFRDWPERPPIIIDESDATLESLPTALALGYAGTSHKNCKGIFKGVGNAALLARERQRHPRRAFLLTGEDLCNVGPVALLQDLTVMATLGILSVERNGHHYNAGLSQFPAAMQEQILLHHADLYHRSPAGWPTLTIEQGCIEIGSLLAQPFGVAFVPDLDSVGRV